MSSPVVISDQFLLWSQLLLLWTIAAYGVTPDPLHGETTRFRWTRWIILLIVRVFVSAALAFVLSSSLSLSALVLCISLFHPLLRYRLPMRWLAECEGFWIFVYMLSSLAAIRGLDLSTNWVLSSISPGQQAALCILGAALLLVVRGGTYIVRGVLRKSGTLPSHEPPDSVEILVEVAPVSSQPEMSDATTADIAAVAEELLPQTVDVEEYNRGRLIGNLERIVLTIVVAAGSYAALAFLVAAKGVVRSDEFEKSRDFTEYFLIGSLSSVLVALCAGMALRFALIRLWPDLLTLQIQ
jgi:hypothetical protein